MRSSDAGIAFRKIFIDTYDSFEKVVKSKLEHVQEDSDINLMMSWIYFWICTEFVEYRNDFFSRFTFWNEEDLRTKRPSVRIPPEAGIVQAADGGVGVRVQVDL